MAAINQSSWRDRAIERSEAITDAWEVSKTYAGRLAEWILFACMIGCILEVLVAVPLWLSNTILGVQAVTLDIGGFALSSMADQARSNGDEQAARKADITGKFLIGIVILTLALITVGLLYAPAKQYTDGAEKVLILIRVVMTVVYGHVIHGLRRQTVAIVITPAQPASDDVLHELRSEIALLGEQIVNLQSVQSAHGSETAIEPEREPEQENIVNLQSYREVHGDETTNETADEPETRPRPRITVNLKQERSAAKRETKREPAKGSGTAQEKAARILKRTPEITASELAKRAGCTPQYAGRLRKKQGV